MKVLIWATTLQADILSLAVLLDRTTDCDLMLVTEHAAAFKKQPFAIHAPLTARLRDRSERDIEASVRRFAPDVVVSDNHLPTFLKEVRLFFMWHGLGRKARGRADLKQFYKNVKRLIGDDPRQPSGRFRAQCYGAPDRDWRVREWGLDPDACEIIGCAFSDLIRNPPYNREALQKYYDIDIVTKKVVLLSISWHYGRMVSDHRDKTGLFASNDGIHRDTALLQGILETIDGAGASCLFCLHDRKRYEPAYLDALTETVAPFDNVMLKFKDENPDNLADLIAADVMVSNLSSFITYFYYLGRPSVHIRPVSDDADDLQLAQIKGGRVRYRKVGPDEPYWMNAPEDNGGLSATTPEEIAGAIRRGLADPDCCKERAAQWIARHVHRPDGGTAARFTAAIRRLAGQA